MPETLSKGLQVPTTGSLPGTWGSVAVNPNMEAVDGILGGFTTIALSNANVTLTSVPAYMPTPGSGPTQSQNALITFQGTLTANVTITFPLPGFYLVQNLCGGYSFVVRLRGSGVGRVICAPPGEVVQVFNTGTDMFYVGMDRVGGYWDLASAVVPAWVTSCTVPPYLHCDGSTFSGGTYPALAAFLGGTTLPDSKGRARYTLDGGSSRVTTAGSGVDGTTLLAVGGNQLMQQHNHPVSITDPGHTHTYGRQIGTNTGQAGASNTLTAATSSSTDTGYTGISATTTNTGTGSSQNMPPVYIGGITLIRAA